MFRRLLFYNFRLVFNLDYWVKRRFTQAGLLILGGSIAAGVFGIDTRQNLAYQLFSLLVTLLLVAFFSSWFFRIRLFAQRYLPRFATVGEAMSYRIRIRNDSSYRQCDLSILEDIQLHPPSFETFLQAKEPHDEKRNWFDNYVGYPRWVWLMYRSKGAQIVEQRLPPLLPQSVLDINMTLIPLRRGYIHFIGMSFVRPDPLGLWNALYTLCQPNNLLVLPKYYPVGPLPLLGSRKYQRGGINLALSVGNTEEFVSLRDYRPRDPLRRIHWKSLAKIGKPVVKEFHDEFFVRYALILDTFTQQPTEQLFEAVISVAASIVCAPRSHDVLLDLMFVGPRAYCFTSGRGLAQNEQLLEILACVEACTSQPFSTLSSLVLEHLPSLSGGVNILLNWDESRQHFVSMLKNLGIPLLTLVVSNRKDLNVPDDIQVLFIDDLELGLAALSEWTG